MFDTSKDGWYDWAEVGVNLQTGSGPFGERWLLKSEQIKDKLGPNFPGGDYVVVEVWDQS